MCIQIDSRCVILNVMQAHNSVDLGQLAAFAVAFKARVHEAYVDISDASVFSVVEEYPEVFALIGNRIVRKGDVNSFAKQEFLDMTINSHFSVDVRNHLHECAKALSEYKGYNLFASFGLIV